MAARIVDGLKAEATEVLAGDAAVAAEAALSGPVERLTFSAARRHRIPTFEET
ncbi:hypothetical protein ACWD4O_41210 [Streptomyces sp. NPDC002623]